MADRPIKELGDKTPLAYARTPNMNKLASVGRVGLVKTIPDGFEPGSDVANLSVLGYNPARYYTGRAPLEAASIGAKLDEADVAFRCNLVTLSDEDDYSEKRMIDYSSDEIETDEAAKLINGVKEVLESEDIHFYVGTSYRHLMVWKGGPVDLKLTPPHDISERVIGSYLPKGDKAGELLKLMMDSNKFLPEHPVNLMRKSKGLRLSTSIWIWGHGRRPTLETFYKKYGLTGAVVSAVDLVKGLGVYAGLDIVKVNGATGTINTNFLGKAQAGLDVLKSGKDFVFIHLEAADEAGHRGEVDTKVKAIEEVDEKVIGTLLSELGSEDYRLMILPDHATPISIRTHSADDVPFLIASGEDLKKSCSHDRIPEFSEELTKKGGFMVDKGYELMDLFLTKR